MKIGTPVSIDDCFSDNLSSQISEASNLKNIQELLEFKEFCWIF
jgi:hypothetical protein